MAPCKGCQKYVIVRWYKDEKIAPKVIAINKTLLEVREHCTNPDTHTDEWFDGWTKQHPNHVKEYNEQLSPWSDR